MHVNQKSIPRQIITQKKLFLQAVTACNHRYTAQSWAASPKLTKYRSETTPQAAVHVYVHSVTPELQPPLPPGSSRDFQPRKHRVPYSTFKYPLASKQPCMSTRSQYHVKSSRKRSFFCKLCACKQKHSSVVGRLTETDQIQIRDDTTPMSTVCLLLPESQPLPPGSSEISNHQQRVPYITLKYPLSKEEPYM